MACLNQWGSLSGILPPPSWWVLPIQHGWSPMGSMLQYVSSVPTSWPVNALSVSTCTWGGLEHWLVVGEIALVQYRSPYWNLQNIHIVASFLTFLGLEKERLLGSTCHVDYRSACVWETTFGMAWDQVPCQIAENLEADFTEDKCRWFCLCSRW